MDEPTAWSQIDRSLDDFDRRAVVDAVTSALASELPPDGTLETSYRARRELIGAVQRAVSRSAGAWYRICGVQVGGERLGGWCWCHSFCRQAGAAPRAVVVSDGAAGVADEVAAIHAYLLSLRAHFAGPDFDDVESLIDVVVEHSETHDAWYGLLSSAAIWLAQARGVELPPGSQARIVTLVRDGCTSWSRPEDPGGLAREVAAVIDAGARRGDPRAALTAAVYASPEERAPYLVLGDWLQAAGDPRGELIALHAQREQLPAADFARAHQALLSAHPELSPELGGPRAQATWHLGFWRSLRLQYLRSDWTTRARDAHARATLACDAARFLRGFQAAFTVAGELLSALAPVSHTLTQLQLTTLTANETQIAWLRRLARLRRLHIWEANLDQAAFAPIAGLPLTHLDCVREGQDNDELLRLLWDHPTLEHLGLGWLSAHAMFELSGLSKLTSLDLAGQHVGDETVENLLIDPVGAQLTVLDVGDSDLSDAVAREFEAAVALVELRAGGNPELGDDLLRALGTLPDLARLEVSHNPITDAGVGAIADRDLTHLSLLGTQLSAGCVEHLARMTRLRILDLRQTGLGLAELAPLARLPNLTHVGLREADAAAAEARYGWSTNGPELLTW